MKRNAFHDLSEWKKQRFRCPLFLYGIRGCGKTYLALDFAKTFFEGCLYINFEQNTPLKKNLESGCQKLFKKEMPMQQTGGGEFPETAAGMQNMELSEKFFLILADAFDVPAEYLANFLIVFDEIMASEPAYQVLQQLSEEQWNFSLLAITSHTPESAALLRMHCLKLFPLQFDEFLQAFGCEWYAEIIKGHYQTHHKIPSMIHQELLALFEDYLAIGGMPAAINEYLAFRTMDNVAAIHKTLYGMHLFYIREQYEESLALKMRQVLDVVPKQLEKENKKFQYCLIRKGATLALYQQAIRTLIKDSLLICCKKAGEESSFRLFPADIGMYNSSMGAAHKDAVGQEHKNGIRQEYKDAAGQEHKDALRQEHKDGIRQEYKDEIGQEHKDALRQEQRASLLTGYAMQAFASCGYEPFFWESDSLAHVDIVLPTKDGAIPVEIKADAHARSKSISVYCNQFQVPYMIKISSQNFEFTDQIKSIPYYAVFCL